MAFALATVRIDDRPTPIIKIEDRCYRLDQVAPEILSQRPYRGLLNVFDDWEANEAKLIAAVDRISRGDHPAKPIETALTPDDFLAPLLYPNKVVCFGANYYEHLRLDAKVPNFNRDNVVPAVFLKAPATSLVGSGKSVRYPSQSQKFDWEAELAVVIGKRGKRVAARDARPLVAGFTIGLDLSARDWQVHPKSQVGIDFFGGKTFDDSCPLGPWIVPARFVDDKNLGIRLSLNGESKQNGHTADMVWTIDEILEVITSHVTLQPGDVVLTGTPAGVGLRDGTFMKIGDKIVAEIDGLGTLEVEIVEDQNEPLEMIHA